jgi:hypothetical protein
MIKMRNVELSFISFSLLLLLWSQVFQDVVFILRTKQSPHAHVAEHGSGDSGRELLRRIVATATVRLKRTLSRIRNNRCMLGRFGSSVRVRLRSFDRLRPGQPTSQRKDEEGQWQVFPG